MRTSCVLPGLYALTLAAGLVCASSAVAAEPPLGEELVRNGDYSNWEAAAPEHWLAGNAVTVTRETGDVRSPPNAVRFSGAGAISSLKANWLSQLGVFTPGRAYHISASARKVSGGGALEVGMGYHRVGMIRSSGQWTQVAFEAIGHEKYKELTLAATKDAVWLIDDVSVKELRLPEAEPAEAPAAAPEIGSNIPQKKLIRVGGYNYPDLVRREIRNMEKLPFDGLGLKLHDWRNSLSVFRPEPYDESKLAQDYEDLRRIEWGSFTDNFIRMITVKREHPRQDWFDDAQWDAIQHNVRLVTKAARIGRCAGACFDAEAYGPNPWAYQQAAHKISKTFAEYEAVVRKRGAQFVQAIESEFPKPKVLTFVLLSQLTAVPQWQSAAEREASLSRNSYGLLPAFLNGMVEGASPGTIIIDGNEESYYYSTSEDFLDAYHDMTQRALRFVDPSLWEQYRSRVRVGQAVYLNECLALRPRKILANYLTPAERLLLLEHNTYWALYTTDEYVWHYDEQVDWWTGRGVPDGCAEAVRSARRKIEKAEPFDREFDAVVERARTALRESMAKSLETRREAVIVALPVDVAKPAIDGDLGDAAWQRIEPLPRFLPPALALRPLQAHTRAWVTYDADALYVAIKCEEPAPDKMSVLGDGRDHKDLWRGDDVEMFVAGPDNTLPYRHFMVNPKGGYWDSMKAADGMPEDMSYDPDWERAAVVGTDFWAAEIAIPWKALDMAPVKPGASLRVNLCRSRSQGGERGLWSPTRKSFVEHARFGTWTFR